MHFKLAILTALARRPDGRATLDEVRRDVEVLATNEDQGTEQRSILDDIDIFQSGLVVPEDEGLQITDAGRSLLDELETFTNSFLPSVPPSSSKSLKLIDELIGTEDRLKIFDLELRSLDEQTDFSPFQQASDSFSDGETTAADAKVADGGQPQIEVSRDPQRADPGHTVSENSN